MFCSLGDMPWERYRLGRKYLIKIVVSATVWVTAIKPVVIGCHLQSSRSEIALNGLREVMCRRLLTKSGLCALCGSFMVVSDCLR